MEALDIINRNISLAQIAFGVAVIALVVVLKFGNFELKSSKKAGVDRRK